MKWMRVHKAPSGLGISLNDSAKSSAWQSAENSGSTTLGQENAGSVQQRGTISAQSVVIKNSVVGEICVSAFRAWAQPRNGFQGGQFTCFKGCAVRRVREQNNKTVPQDQQINQTEQ